MSETNRKLKQILFAHSGGGQGGPGQGSFDLVSTLRAELSDGYEIHYPIIDNPKAPTYKMWKKLFEAAFENKTEPLILVGHSLGASVLLKYLSEEKPHIIVSALFLLSTPLWGKDGWEVEEFVLPEKFEAQLRHLSDIYLYHSKNDDIVPFEHLRFYKEAFPDATVRELNGKDHAFTKGLPELVSDIKKF